MSGYRFFCEHCGIEAKRKIGGANKAENYRNRWCSMGCRVGAAARLRAELAGLRRIAAARIALERQQRRQALAAEKAARLNRVCLDCSTVFEQRTHLGRPQIRCVGCGELHAEQVKRTERRVHKASRRAKTRGAGAERIDPVKVFERDGWRCHVCRRKTPKRLRGSHDGCAPELDHIVTLADGGSHTWGNVACACRSCNQSKGARSFGQIGLPIAA